MKKISPDVYTLHETVEHVVVFEDDFEHILEILRAAGYSIALRDGDYEYESIDEVREKRGPRPTSLSIYANPEGEKFASVEVTFRRGRTTLAGYKVDELGAVPYQLLNYLRKRTSRVGKILGSGLWLAILFGMAVTYIGTPSLRLMLGIGELLVFAVLITSSVYSRTRSGLTLRRRHQGGFLRRNADQVWLVILGAIAGTIATLVATALTGK